MMQARIRRSITFGLALAALLLTGCSAPVMADELTASEAAAPVSGGDDALAGGVEDGLAQPQAAPEQQPIASGTLSPEEAAGLLYMREEEKLAHDLYLALYDAWGLRLFSNIAASEAVHTAAVERLLTQYGIADPAAGMAPGSFSDPALQELYDQLLPQALHSLEGALQAGALVEEVDIQDLTIRLAQTANGQIEQLYANLMAGSENHLRAFVSQYSDRSGDAYSAQVLASGQVEAILAASSGRGRGWNSN